MKTTKRLTTTLLLSLSLLFIGCEKEIDSSNECNADCGKVTNTKWISAVDQSYVGWEIIVHNDCNDTWRSFLIQGTGDNPTLPDKYQLGKTVCEAYADWK